MAALCYPRHWTPDLKPQVLSPQPLALNNRLKAPNPRPETLNPKTSPGASWVWSFWVAPEGLEFSLLLPSSLAPFLCFSFSFCFSFSLSLSLSLSLVSVEGVGFKGLSLSLVLSLSLCLSVSLSLASICKVLGSFSPKLNPIKPKPKS